MGTKAQILPSCQAKGLVRQVFQPGSPGAALPPKQNVTCVSEENLVRIIVKSCKIMKIKSKKIAVQISINSKKNIVVFFCFLSNKKE